MPKRVFEHKEKKIEGFTSKYNCTKLVWFKETENIMSAIEAEKRIKRLKRSYKERTIIENNSGWKDLAKDWYI